MESSNNTSTIILNRKKAWTFKFHDVEVILNGSKVAQLKNGSSESIIIPAGTHTLAVIAVGFGAIFAQSCQMIFDAQAGESYSFVIEPAQQNFTIVLSSSSESFRKATLESVPSTQTEAVKQEQPLEPNDAQPLGLVESEEQQISQEQPELQDKVQVNSNPMDLDDEHYYLEVEQEIQQFRLDDALWSKCTALAKDNPMEAISLYRQERVKRLKKGIKVKITTNQFIPPTPLPAINYQGCLKPILGFVGVIIILNLFWSYQDYQEEQRQIEENREYALAERKAERKRKYDEERKNPAWVEYQEGCSYMKSIDEYGANNGTEVPFWNSNGVYTGTKVLTSDEILQKYIDCIDSFKGKKYLYGPDS